MFRIVIDTNLIIAGRYNDRSASAKIIDLCLQKKLQPVYSDRVKNENQWILDKVKPSAEYMKKIYVFFTKCIYVMPTERIDICSDNSDNIYFETALAGQAQYIITNDRHLLEHDGYMGVRVKRPNEFLKEVKI
ncbi:MAG: putative toxin-antitoxin system toxin component, PIN family [Candidatus Aenigmarchaeota archaeon]|nr:putative toxin-antitoxin system toxin component, PIN family [Candidatus Aenigmarchaeota archaeon]